MDDTAKYMEESARHVCEYKEYAKKNLPQCKKLWMYIAPDFDIEAYEEKDLLSSIEFYLKDLKKYSSVLSRAAQLRQSHFERYIQNKFEEDENHTHWRVGLNRVAQDATQKFRYWSDMKDKILEEHIVDFQKLEHVNKEIDVAYETANVDYDKSVSSKKISNPPKSSRSNKRALQRQILLKRAAREKQGMHLAKTLHREIQEDEKIEKSMSGNASVDFYRLRREIQTLLIDTGDHDAEIIPYINEIFNDNVYVAVELSPHRCEDCVDIANFYASLYVKNVYSISRKREVDFLAHSQCFRHRFFSSVFNYAFSNKLDDDGVIDIIHFNIELVTRVFRYECRREMKDTLKITYEKYLTDHNENLHDSKKFDLITNIYVMLEICIENMWVDSHILDRISDLKYLINLRKFGTPRDKAGAKLKWRKLAITYPEVLTPLVEDCCKNKGYNPSADLVKIHKTLLDHLKRIMK